MSNICGIGEKLCEFLSFRGIVLEQCVLSCLHEDAITPRNLSLNSAKKCPPTFSFIANVGWSKKCISFLLYFQISCYAIPAEPGSELNFVSLVPSGPGSQLDDAALLSMLEDPANGDVLNDMEALTALSLIADLSQADQVLVEKLAKIVRERKKARWSE